MDQDLPPLWEHQRIGVERASQLSGFGFFFEMGTGKTRTTIEILRKKFNEEKRIFRTLIFCPPVVCKTWRAEWLRYSNLAPERVYVLGGSGQRRVSDFKKRAYKEAEGSSQKQGMVFISNHEALLVAKGELYEEFKKWSPEALIWDESHRFKNPQSKRSKKAHDLSNPWDKTLRLPLRKPNTYLLSGTPILNNPMDAFQQFLIMDGGKTFGSNFYAFRARYFRDKNERMPAHVHFPEWEVRTLKKHGFDAIGELREKMAGSSMHIKKEDCLDLPPLIKQIQLVEMSSKQASAYKQMEDEFITFVESEEGQKPVSAQLAITKALRLMQISSGYAKTVDGEEVEFNDNSKLDALSDLLTELTPVHKVLVWAVWHSNYRSIRRRLKDLGIESVEVHGGVSARDRDEAVERFNNDPAVRVFLGNPGSGGIGVNLVPASYSIFYSRNFSLEQSLQAEARNYRAGSECHERVTRIDLVTEGTIEEKIVERLLQKKEIGDSLLKHIVREIRDGKSNS